MAVKLALYGYDTDIGKLVIETLDQKVLDFDELYPLSPLSGEYDAVTAGGRNFMITPIESFDFAKADIAIFACTPDESQRWADIAREQGCIVIDGSRALQDQGPVILPELNEAEALNAVKAKLALPPLSIAAQLALILNPLHDEFGIESCTAVALESVSEHGRSGTETLARETAHLLNGREPDPSDFEAQIAFNLHDRMGKMQNDGYSEHEAQAAAEVRKLLGRFEGGLELTALQVPVFFGHTIYLNIILEEKVSLDEIKAALSNCAWLKLNDKDEVCTPVTHSVNTNAILITRLHLDQEMKRGLSLIAMMDNTRRGEAVIMVQIAKLISKLIHK